MIDLVFPKDNEKEFIKKAEILDYKALCFIYPCSLNPKQKISLLQKNTKLKLYFGLQASAKDILKVKKISDLIIVKSSISDQKILEKLKPDLMYDFELFPGKDPLKYRASGLNHVLCRFAQKNKTIIAFSFSSILNSKNKAKILGRIMQNIRLCKKYKVNTSIASFAKYPYEIRSPHDLISLLITLDIDPKKAKSSLTSILDKIKSSMEKRSPGYVKQGIEL